MEEGERGRREETHNTYSTCSLSGSWSEVPPEKDGWRLVQKRVSQSEPNQCPDRRGSSIICTSQTVKSKSINIKVFH